MAGFINRFRGSGKPAARVDQHGSAPYGPAPMLTGALIGAGGEGAVYDDREDPAMVIKVLHPQHATAERASKLQAMCDNPPPNWQALGWPNAVEANSNGLRYRMPKVPKDAGTAYRFISANERRQLPKFCQSYEYRSRIGVNIAEALRGLHATHVRIGDVNPSNILVDDDGAVTLIDCDSFQIPGPPRAPAVSLHGRESRVHRARNRRFQEAVPVPGQRQLRAGGAPVPTSGQRQPSVSGYRSLSGRLNIKHQRTN